MRNVAYRWLSSRERRTNIVSIDEAFTPRERGSHALIASDEPSAEAMLIAAEESTLVLAALADLPPAFREVLVLREIEEASTRRLPS